MSIPVTVTKFLRNNDIDYRVTAHPHTESSMRTAEAAHVSGERIAKGVLLKDEGGFVLAVLPASHNVRIGVLQDLLGRPVEPAPELHPGVVFPDYELCALPALGPAYDILTVVDPSLLAQPEVYFEAGDHEELIHVDGAAFNALLSQARGLDFAVHKS